MIAVLKKSFFEGSASSLWGALTLLFGWIAVTPAGAADFLSPTDLVSDALRNSELIASPDGRDIYAVEGRSIPRISHFSRSDIDGGLTWRSALYVSPIGFDLVAGHSAVVSPDGRFLYAGFSNFIRGVIIVAERLADGSLREVDLLDGFQTQASSSDLHLALSPDGRHLYVAARELLVFERDESNGLLTQKANYPLESQVFDLALAPDGSALYAVGNPATMTSYQRHADGLLTVASEWNDFTVPRGVVEAISHLVIEPSGDIIALAQLDFTEVLVRFQALGGGAVAPLFQSTSVAECCDLEALTLTLHPSGDALYLGMKETNSIVGFVASYEPRDDGTFQPVASYGNFVGIEHASRPDSLAIAPDGESLFVNDLDRRSAFHLKIGADPGEITPGENHKIDLLVPRDLELAMSGEHLYAVTVGGVVHWQLSESGLGPAEAIGLFDAGQEPLALRDIELSADGELAVLGLSEPHSLMLAEVDEEGHLQLIEDSRLDLEVFWPEVYLSPDARHVYLTNSREVGIFEITEGRWREVATIAGDSIRDLTFTSDGLTVYAATDAFDESRVFSRDPESGILSEISAGADFPRDARQFVISPDQRHLYAMRDNPHDGFFAAYDREREHKLIGEWPEFRFGNQARDGGLVFDPDGRLLYVASQQWGFQIFRRDPRTGSLTRVESLDSEVGDAFRAATYIAVGKTANEVYLASFEDQTVSLAKRQCVAGDAHELCLAEGRLRVEVEWQDFDGRQGGGLEVDGTSADSGLMWFFDDENWEVLVKVVDGCSFNDRFWVFSAATTNVAYTLNVTDGLTGQRASYSNSAGMAAAAITDTSALDICHVQPATGSSSASLPERKSAEILMAEHLPEKASEILLLRDERFALRVSWTDFEGNSGSGKVVPLQSSDSGLFYFFAGENWEMLIKVLDACDFNNRFWVFSAATTNVAYILEVEDTLTGAIKRYENPLGHAAAAVTDTDAFATCE